MRLDFNVLWIDDQPQNIRSIQERIKTLILREGFHFSSRNATSISEAKKYLDEAVFLDELDLILVDYDLGGENGDEALRNIRDRLPYRDIIFYSAVASADLKKLAYEQDVVGIYCASRADLVEAFQGIFDMLVRKVVDIDHSRGIVLGATSEIDVVVCDCLLAIDGMRNGDEKLDLLAQAKERVREQSEKQKKDVEKTLQLETFIDFMQKKSAMTCDHKLRFLIQLLKDVPEFKDVCLDLRKYRDTVVPQRNVLAHARLIPDGKVYEDTTGESKKINLEDMKTLRQELLTYRDVFSELLKSLSSAGA